MCDQIANALYPLGIAEDLAATIKFVKDAGARIVAKQSDARDRVSLSAAVQAGLNEFVQLDIVVTNACVTPLQTGAEVGAMSSTSTSPASSKPYKSRYRP